MNKNVRYEPRKPQGELILPAMADAGGFYFQCCDCALIHRIDFAISEQHGLEMRVYGDQEETDKARERWLNEG